MEYQRLLAKVVLDNKQKVLRKEGASKPLGDKSAWTFAGVSPLSSLDRMAAGLRRSESKLKGAYFQLPTYLKHSVMKNAACTQCWETNINLFSGRP